MLGASEVISYYSNTSDWQSHLQQVKVTFISVTTVIDTPLDSNGHTHITSVTKILGLAVR